jgi:hypothetical protein
LKNIIIDSQSLFKDPGILSLASPENRLIVTGSVLNQVRDFPVTGSGISFLPAVERAQADGTVQFSILPAGQAFSQAPHGINLSQFAPGSVLDFVSDVVAYRKSNPQADFALVTGDKSVAAFAESMGIETIKPSKIRAILSKGAHAIAAVETLVDQAARSQMTWFLLNLAMAGSLVFMIHEASAFLYPFLKSLGFAWSLAAISATGLLLYLLRSYYRQAYGFTEIFFGVWFALRVLAFSLSQSQSSASVLLQIFGGLYVVVRGVENLGKGMHGTRFFRFISWLFDNDKAIIGK